MKRRTGSTEGSKTRARTAFSGRMPAIGLLTILCPAMPAASAQDAVGAGRYDEAAGYTLRLGADSARQEGAEADVRAARASFLPKVEVGAEWVLAGSTVYHPDITKTDPDSYRSKDPNILGIEASLTVFDGFRRLNMLRAATSLAAAGRETSLDSRQQLFLDSATATLTVIRDRAIVEKRRTAVQRQRKTLAIARDMLAEQSATLTDIALAGARVDEAEAGLAFAAGELEASELAYRKLLGRSPAPKLTLKVPAARLPKTAVEAAARAEAGAPGPRFARHIADAARFRADAARSAYFPTIEVVGRASSTYDVSPILDQVDNYAALLRLKVPIFDPTIRPELDAARAEAAERRYDVETARLDTRTAARTFFAARASLAVQSLEITRQIANASEAVKGMRIEQALGTRTVNDVLDAQSSLSEAEIVRARIAYEHDRTAFALLAAMGELAEYDVPQPMAVTFARANF